MQSDFDRYVGACDYPGRLDETAVESSLRDYLKVLGIERKVVRIKPDWELDDYPDLKENVKLVLDDLIKRNPGFALAARDALAALAALDARDARDALAALAARDARDALDALDARDARDALDALAALDALRSFAAWCIQYGGWFWWGWELSIISTTYLGALQNKNELVQKWSQPLFEAFVSGAWILSWTKNTLYWVAKPAVHVEKSGTTRRLHNENYAAIESDVENIYYWHGVEVPAFVVVKPEWITIPHINKEENAEVRRVMIERYGTSRYLLDSGAKPIHQDERGILYRKEIPDDEPLVMVRVQNSTPEPDGSFKDYFLRVPPDMQTASQAIAWTFDEEESDYRPLVES